MAVASNPLMRQIVKPAGLSATHALSDSELVRRFAASKDEVALAALIRRHGPLILRTSERLLGNRADAEDVFQAVFLVLARKVTTLKRPEAIGPWLYGVAQKVARNLRRKNRTRAARERQTPAKALRDAQEDLSLREAETLLHEELAGMKSVYCDALVLCYLEGHSRDEAAHRLGLPLGTFKKRLEKAKHILHARLTKRGLGLSSALIAALFSEISARAVLPMALVEDTAQAAILFVANNVGVGAIVSAQALSLANAAVKTVTFAKAVLGGVLILSLISADAVVRWLPAHEDKVDAVVAVATPVVAAPIRQEQNQLTPAQIDAARKEAMELLQEALACLKKVEGDWVYRTYVEAAMCQSNLGARDLALQTLATAKGMTKNRGENWDFAKAYGRMGAMKELRELIAATPTDRDLNLRTEVIQWSAIELAKRRHAKEALEIVAMAQGDVKQWYPCLVRRYVAIAEAEAGNYDKARVIIAEIVRLRVYALTGIVHAYSGEGEPGLAQILAKKGKKQDAKKAIEQALEIALKTKEYRDSVLASVGCAQVLDDDWQGALKTADNIETEFWKGHVVALLARAHAKQGLVDDALAHLQRLKADDMQAYTLCHVGMGQAEARDLPGARKTFAKAEQLIATLKDSSPDPTYGWKKETVAWILWSRLVSAVASTGDMEQATKIQKDRLPQDGAALFTMIYAQIKRDDFSGALAATRNHAEFLDKGDVYWRIAQSQTKKVGAAAVLPWARQLTSEHDKACALLGVVQSLTERYRLGGGAGYDRVTEGRLSQPPPPRFTPPKVEGKD